MEKVFSLDQIRAYWHNQAITHGTSSAASWTDRPVIELEIDTIAKYLRDNDRVLDIGCANGYSTLRLASLKRAQFKGVDFVPEMIEHARHALTNAAESLKGTVEFDVGDITALKEPREAFDVAIVVRVLINLGTWERQQHSLRQCALVVKPGGLLLLSEATVQGWRRLNEFRREWKLPDIPMPPFNLYLDQDSVVETAAEWFDLVEISNFASTYYVGTRVLKPLLADNVPGVEVGNPEMCFNDWFATLPAAGDFGTQKLFVLRKR